MSPAGPPPPPARKTARKETSFEVTDQGITWVCRRCGERNPLAAPQCSSCGAPFAETVRETPPNRPRDPGTAALLSLLFPGAGHAYAGRWSQAMTRAILTLWSLAIFATGVVSALQTAGMVLAAAFGAAALALWLSGAHDAYREARGEPGRALMKGRSFLYVTLGLLLMVLVAAVTAVSP